MAEEVLIAADLSRARRRQVVDKVAAAIILQRWLDARPSASEEKP
jgi:putative Holliday junction resolvase